MKNKNDVVAVVFVPSADCGKDSQRWVDEFVLHYVEEELGKM